ncbi:MAG: hypothetical protein P4L31_04385 [Candidatus Babeliales bacterium]|nr:hypothetical protein [Candidatus Babeliales bacterium]
MKQSITRTVLCAVMLCGLSGCGKVVDWGIQTFDQGKDVERLFENGRAYVRSITIYDQFDTAGMFDALWLSDEVRSSYVASYGARRAKQDELQKTFLRRQLEENNHFITFYVLSPFEFSLGEPQSDWQLFLKVDGVTYYPLELKVADLELEYQSMFGKRYTRFKQPYAAKFAAKDLQDKLIITPQTDVIELCFRSSIKEASLVWHLYATRSELTPTQEKKIVAQEAQEEKEARLEPEVSQVKS